MTTFQLEYFLTAAQTLNFTTAAERLYMTQPALSRQIAALENELGVTLFKRSHNVVELTLAGRRFYEEAVHLYKRFTELQSEMRDLGAGIEGRLRIGLMEDQSISPILAAAIHHLISRHPNILFDIRRLNYVNLVKQLNEGEIDMFQALLYEGLEQPGYRMLPFSVERLYLAYNPTYVHIDEAYLDGNMEIKKALGGCPVILPSTSTYPEIIRKNLPAVNTLNARHVDAISSIPLYLQTGIGVTLTNQGSLIAADKNIALIPLGVETITQGVVWLEDNTNPILDMLICHLEEEKQLHRDD